MQEPRLGPTGPESPQHCSSLLTYVATGLRHCCLTSLRPHVTAGLRHYRLESPLARVTAGSCRRSMLLLDIADGSLASVPATGAACTTILATQAASRKHHRRIRDID